MCVLRIFVVVIVFFSSLVLFSSCFSVVVSLVFPYLVFVPLVFVFFYIVIGVPAAVDNDDRFFFSTESIDKITTNWISHFLNFYAPQKKRKERQKQEMKQTADQLNIQNRFTYILYNILSHDEQGDVIAGQHCIE